MKHHSWKNEPNVLWISDEPPRELTPIMAILKQCIESFNNLDAEMDFIETVEREDICEEFEAIVHACGLGAYTDLADRWRDS